ncbi:MULTISPECIES: hypothetical protein [unclassified Mesorhizobium]|uniref:hypothetical protein n=1 Tax=unclassified Mesorhizobium TaxID=325217 RepID=UPI001129FBAA|nr:MULTISPECIES: hypothetical protein [unclassified Mesorhizobium]MBZ9998523.1 hypothetical protein [Mesorhizobium sp. B264B2A]MCA0005068.1 hypothetical protein [Mesorhizobium sp. B264B1B]MCA0019752.1 hypothetical protein [Mesorhizobium sp. B264B1A]TPJ45676.1 hypothetical protein FJ437_15710 [Mesorhizobium sp. B2-6-6]
MAAEVNIVTAPAYVPVIVAAPAYVPVIVAARSRRKHDGLIRPFKVFAKLATNSPHAEKDRFGEWRISAGYRGQHFFVAKTAFFDFESQKHLLSR